MPHFNPFAEHSDSDPEDVALVARVQAGNRQALETLLARHQPWIYNILVRMLYHPAEAEDATQEVLIKVLTKLSTFEGRSSFRTWLYRIVVNHALPREPQVLGIEISRLREAARLFRAATGVCGVHQAALVVHEGVQIVPRA